MLRYSHLLMLIIIWAVFILSATGCMTAAQRQVVTIMSTMKGVSEKANICIATITSNPAYEPILQHTPLDGRTSPTLSQLADRSFATEEHASIIITIHNEMAVCREQLIEASMPVLPGIIPIFVRYYHESDINLVDLMERKITWGDYNKQKVRLRDENMDKARIALTQLQRDLEASHNAELLQQQIALASLSNWAVQQQALVQRQQLINSLNRPVVTSCSSAGTFVRCVSR